MSVGVVLKNGFQDGDPKETQDIKDERLGEKIQLPRTLRVLEKGPRDLKQLRMISLRLLIQVNPKLALC